MLPLGLGRSAVEIHENLVAVNPDVDVDVYGLRVYAVVVYVVNELPFALRQGGYSARVRASVVSRMSAM